MRPLNTIVCQRNGKRYGPRIDQADWNIHRSKLVELHAAKLRRADMLEILKKDCNFHPTLPQLNRQMEMMGLGKGGKLTVPRPSNRTQRYFHQLNTPVDFIVEYPSMLPVRQPADLQVMEFFSAKQHEPLDESRKMFEKELAPSLQLSDSIVPSEMSLESPEAVSSEQQPQLMLAEYPTGANNVAELLVVSDSTSGKGFVEPSDSTDTPNVDPMNPLDMSEYCLEACCEKPLQYHKRMVAAGFLSSLQCWSHASDLLRELISNLENDPAVSISDRMWVKINYNRINGSIFHPDRPTSIWSKGFRDVAEPLHDYIDAAQNEVLSSPLAHLCLTGQFRATGIFQYYLPNPTSLDSYESQIQALRLELIVREEKNRLISRLVLWCFQTLQLPKLRESMKDARRRTKSTLGFRDQILPGLLACHFVSRWIDQPCPVILQFLARLRTSPATTFKLDVMLPETLAVISTMVVLRLDGFPHMSSSSFVDDLLKCLKIAIKRLYRLSPEEYCPEFAATMTELYNQSSDNTQQKTSFKDELAFEVASKIIGDSDSVKGPFTWMRSADTFKVHDFVYSEDESEVSLEPKLLLTPKKPRTESSSSSRSMEDQASIFSVANCTPNSKSSCSTINSLVKPCEEINVDEKSERSVRRRLQKRPEIPPRRYPTNSTNTSWRMSLDEMRCIQARTSTMAFAQRVGISDAASRTPSTLSKMSLGSRFSFNRTVGIDRVSSVASSNRFSYTRDDSFRADVPAEPVEQVCESSGFQPHDLRDCELQRKISDWGKHCMAPTHQETSDWRQSYTMEEDTDDE